MNKFQYRNESGKSSKFDNDSFLVKKGFDPSHILFQGKFSGKCNLAIDANEEEICISQKKGKDMYDVAYFGLDEVKSSIIQKKDEKTVKTKSASWGTKATGALVGGLAGSLVASAMGNKWKEVTIVKEVLFRIYLRADPKVMFDIVIYKGFFGLKERELNRRAEYKRALKYHKMIVNSNKEPSAAAEEERPILSDKGVCPKCGFSYGWDGEKCSHCGHN